MEKADINIYGVYIEGDGIGSLSCEMTRFLIKKGYKVNIIKSIPHSFFTQTTFNLPNYEPSDKTLFLVPPPFKAHGSFQAQTFPRELLEKSENFGFFFWETSELPNEWSSFINKYFKAIFVASKFNEQIFKDSGVKCPIYNVGLGIEFDKINKIKDTIFTVGYIGTFNNRKNIKNLIEAFQVAFFGKTNVRLKILCRFREGNYFDKEIQPRLKKDPRIIVGPNKLIPKSELLQWWSDVDCYFSMSMTEGFGKPSREALSFGIPVIVVNGHSEKELISAGVAEGISISKMIPGVYEWIGNRTIGEVPYPSLEDAINKLQKMYQQGSDQEKVKKGLEWVQQFNWDLVCTSVLDKIEISKKKSRTKQRALITGITGQDGSYLAELLLSKNYEVYGIKRRTSQNNTQNIDHILDKIDLIEGDMTDSASLIQAVNLIKPNEIYNLAAMSHVGESFTQPVSTGEITGLGVTRLLEAIRLNSPASKFITASCYDNITRIVTQNGLKTIYDINENDKVYTLNEETKNIELKKIKKIIIQNYFGQLIKIQNQRIQLNITPNHKVLLEKNDNKLFYIDADKIKNIDKKSYIHSISLPIPNCYGKEEENIDFSNFINYENLAKNSYKNILKRMKTADFLYLMGIYIGDGYVTSKAKNKIVNKYNKVERDKKGKFTYFKNQEKILKNYESVHIALAIPEKDKARKKVIEVLERNHIEYHLYPIIITFSSYDLAKMFKLCGENVYKKHIPEWVFQYDPKLLKNLFEGLIDSDGTRRIIERERYSYTTVSKQLKDNFVLLCLKLGKIPKVSLGKKKDVYIKNRKIAKENLKDAYIIYVGATNKRKIHKKHIFEEKYEGIVWCLEVEDNHNFLIERNGFYTFCGNSSEMFGKVRETPQKETTPFHSRSPYGAAKVYAYHMTRLYREAYKIFACNSIAFNHESERRGETFVTRKITKGIAKIKKGEIDHIAMGNLDSKRDWSFAGDIVYGMWLILQQEEPDDFILASGETHSIREFCEIAFDYAGLGDYHKYITIDPKFFRPAEVDILIGDITKAKTKLGWQPKVKFKELIKMMIDNDCKDCKGKPL